MEGRMPLKKRLETLYWDYYDHALRLAFLLTGDKHTAEDLVQDAFVRVYARFGDLRRQDAFLAYLRRTIINLSKDHHRKQQREKKALEDFGRLGVPEYEASVPEQENLLRAAEMIPRRQFVAIVLRYCEGLSEAETAQVLQSSVSAVKSLTSRGLETLRRNLGEPQ